MTQTRNMQRKKKRRALRVFLFVMLFTFIAVGSAFSYFVHTLSNVTATSQVTLDRGEKSVKREEVVVPDQDNISVLILGVDDRDNDVRGRTDAMLLATFNIEESSIKILSIPRDSYVSIPSQANKDKINHAHAYGGTDLTIETVENLLDIPVDYYLKLNFTAFVEVIDALGGVELDVPFSFSEQNSNGVKGAITLQEGTHTLNGEEALAFARMRKSDPRGDIGRGERQQQVIEAIIKKAASFSTITNFSSVMDSISEQMTTNLSFSNMISFHKYATAINNIEKVNFEGADSRIDGVYYYQIDETSRANVSNTLRQHLGLTQ